MELLVTPMNQVPPLAIEFARNLARESGGMCGEVFVTAYSVYAQCVEGCECNDQLYMARPQDQEWFDAARERKEESK
jgi:hypothetical protein